MPAVYSLEKHNSGEVVNGRLIGYGTDDFGNYIPLHLILSRKDLRDVCMVFQQFNLGPHLLRMGKRI